MVVAADPLQLRLTPMGHGRVNRRDPLIECYFVEPRKTIIAAPQDGRTPRAWNYQAAFVKGLIRKYKNVIFKVSYFEPSLYSSYRELAQTAEEIFVSRYDEGLTFDDFLPDYFLMLDAFSAAARCLFLIA